MNLILVQQPTGHVRVGDSLKLFCNISVEIWVLNITSSNISVSFTWVKMSQLSFDHKRITSNGHFDISYKEIKSDRQNLYSSILFINSLIFSDSTRYNCIAMISPYPNSNLFNATEQSSSINVQLSKCWFYLSFMRCKII